MARDLYAEVQQSACDKLLDSVDYPLTVFERQEDFPGCSRLAALDDGPIYEYTKAEMKEMLRESVARDAGKDPSVHNDLYSFAGSIVEQAKRALDASESAGKDYEGPDPKELRAIVEGGIENLVETLGDWGLYAWCPYLRVRAMKRPRINLRSPQIDLKGIKIEVKATGELWAKYPWLNCSRLCTKWKKVIKCERIGRLTVAPEVAAEAHANLEPKGAEVHARGEFDKLRLAYDILDKIPLEGIANRALKDKLVFVFDASKLVVTVPVLGSKFKVDSLNLPPNPQAIGVEVVIKKV